ncbi:MAG: hypothetical protein SFZ24_09750 [Planctomycetota bacterium]|nr:hypothetical protein [Planctomycetota bacterium]
MRRRDSTTDARTVRFDATRLTDAQRRELLKSLDRSAGAARERSRRVHDRFEYHEASVPLTVQHSSGAEINLSVHARSLSVGGIGFLHGGYLHPGTQVRVLLRTRQGIDKLVLGRVACCRHVARNIHEIGVQFHDKIDVADFCQPNARIVSAVSTALRPPELTGLAACMCASKADRAALSAWLSSTGMNVIETNTIGATLDRIKRLPLVVLVADGRAAPELSSSQLVGAIRSAGFGGVLLVATVDGAPAPEANGDIPRPFQLRTFMDVLASACSPERVIDDSPVISSIAADPGTAQLLKGYVEQLGLLASQIEGALASEDRERASQACQTIRSTAVGYGFAAIGEAASNALLALQGVPTVKGALRHLNLLVSLCRRATHEPRPADRAA